MANKLYAGDTGQYVAAAPDITEKNLQRWHGTRPNDQTSFDGTNGPLALYLGQENKIRTCPALQNVESDFEAGCGGYGYNDRGVGSRAYLEGFVIGSKMGMSPGAIQRPAETVMFTDTAFLKSKRGRSYLIEYSFAESYYHLKENEPELGDWAAPSIHFRHEKKANVVWCDGHISAEILTTEYSSLQTKSDIGWFGGANNDLFDPF